MKTSQNGKEIIKQNEDLRLEAYLDPARIPTIGWGHTAGVKMGDKITMSQAERFLTEDLAIAESEIRRQKLAVNQNQFDALASLIFNIGVGQFRTSTLLKKVKANPCDPDIRNQFNRWIYSNGKVLPGLVKRRKQEADLYFKPTL